MNPKDLRSKLDAIKSRDIKPDPASSKASSPLPPQDKALLENGWRKLDDMVYEKVSFSESPLSERISDFLLEDGAAAEDLVFYDTETTGLSGGAGNIAFLIGFGIPEGARIKTVQILLSDFPGEPAFIREISRYITPRKIYVSYNGKCFDSGIIKSRFAMNGLVADFGYQFDLLYPSRRLFKSVIGSCTLGAIEKNILGKTRMVDVPGALVPDLYFDFIRCGDYSSFSGVAEHHREDIESLVLLLSVFENMFRDPHNTLKKDMRGLARQLSVRHPGEAEKALIRGLDEGSFQAAKELGLYYRKLRDYSAACAVWETLWKEKKSVYAGIELAKHLEHRLKNAEMAYAVTAEILSLERIRIKAVYSELLKRHVRLKGKIEKKIQKNQADLHLI